MKKKLLMKPSKFIIVFFLIFSKCLVAQDYLPFEEPVTAKINGEHSFLNEKGEKSLLKSNAEIIILGRGIDKFGGKYWIENENGSGFISFAWFSSTKDFRVQDNKLEGLVNELKKTKEKEVEIKIAKEKEAELKVKEEKIENLKNDCNYYTNEVDIFDKVRIIRTSPKEIADYLRVGFYAKGNRKEVVFHAIGLGCTSSYENNRSWVKVMLENNDVVTFYHSGQLDCGSFELWGNISNSEIIRLKKSPIKAIKLEGTKYNQTITDFHWPTFFIDQLKCYNPISKT